MNFGFAHWKGYYRPNKCPHELLSNTEWIQYSDCCKETSDGCGAAIQRTEHVPLCISVVMRVPVSCRIRLYLIRSSITDQLVMTLASEDTTRIFSVSIFTLLAATPAVWSDTQVNCPGLWCVYRLSKAAHPQRHTKAPAGRRQRAARSLCMSTAVFIIFFTSDGGPMIKLLATSVVCAVRTAQEMWRAVFPKSPFPCWHEFSLSKWPINIKPLTVWTSMRGED